MNPSAIKRIAKELRNIACSISPISEKQDSFRIHDGVAYNITNEAAISFNEIIGEILKQEDYTRKFPSKYIDKKLKTVFAKLLSEENFNVENELTTLFTELTEFKQDSVIFLKVDGLILSACFSLGRVRFVPGDKYLIDDLNNKSSAIISTVKHGQAGKDSINEIISSQMKSELSGGCVAVVEANAEPVRAYEVGKEEVRRAIDLLRLSSKAIYSLSEDIRIGLKGEHPKAIRQGFVFSEKGLNTESDSVDSVIPFEINQDTLGRMNDIGIFKVSDALTKKQANNFEESLIRSIHWFSVALTQDENSNSFLFLIVALESLFKPEQGNSIGGTVAESVALLISDNLDGRKKLVSIVRKFYGKRSGVAHGGKKTISETDLYTLMNIAGTSIMESIEKISTFATQKEFMSWIEDQKLS